VLGVLLYCPATIIDAPLSAPFSHPILLKYYFIKWSTGTVVFDITSADLPASENERRKDDPVQPPLTYKLLDETISELNPGTATTIDTGIL
jgi:hypothetical protein